ncbi:hypothetical protein C7B69_08845 [filamentous cyanobacterium Phorm 46]|nr:hypothetical protein C7B69_08845 [filamentous cyanobacterium Phorm 46]PSB50818.1 hypothetical protein C7B67_13075 [filamentous cyanobacterium Phorm 6]
MILSMAVNPLLFGDAQPVGKKSGVAKPEMLPIPTLYLTPIDSQDIICVPKITYNGDCTYKLLRV